MPERGRASAGGSKVMVTGGAGFIGSTIVDRLIGSGHTVVVVDDLSSGKESNLTHAVASGACTLHRLDIRAPELLEVMMMERPAAIMHLAAQIDVRVSVADPVLDAGVNILGTLNVLETARRAGVGRVLVASSGGCVYGEARTLPIRETFRGRPRSPYGISKRVLHDYLAFYRETHGLRSAVLALSNVYGPRQDPHGEAGVVAIFLRAMLSGGEPMIFGDGLQTRDLIAVDDVADAWLAALDRGDGVYNIGTGIQTSILDLWRACADLTGYDREVVFADARTGELQHNALDTARARRDLGWTPRVGLREGLDRTMAWVASTLDADELRVG